MITFSKTPDKNLDIPGIYLLKIDKHLYIGSSISVKQRLLQHRQQLAKIKHQNKYMQSCYNKYGVKSSYYCLLESCEASIRLEREKCWIDKLTPDMNFILDPVSQNNCSTSSKIVYQYSLDGSYIGFYPSCSEVERILGINSNCISKVASGFRSSKSSGGFMWSYTKVENLLYNNNSNKAKIKAVTMYSKLGKKILSFLSIADATRYLLEQHDNYDSLAASIAGCAKNFSYAVKDKYLFSFEDKEYITPTSTKGYPVLQKDQYGNLVIWNSTSEAAKKLGIRGMGINSVVKGYRKSYLGSIWSDARTKQGELLETPITVCEDNQQPSLSRDTLEGSTTNSRIQTSNVEDSNGNTSALPS